MDMRQAFVKKVFGEEFKSLIYPHSDEQTSVSPLFTTDHPGAHKPFGSAVLNQRERERAGAREREVEVNGNVTE